MKIRLDPLDRLFSEYIRLRANNKCERCGAYSKRLQCSHYFGRARKSVRYDEENAVALCFGCHQYFTSYPLEHTEWFKKRLGRNFDLLLGRMRITHPPPDKKIIELYLKERIRQLGNDFIGE